MPRNYMNTTSRVDGGIGSPNGKQNVDPVYRMQGFQEEKAARATAIQYGRSKAAIAMDVAKGSLNKNRSGIK